MVVQYIKKSVALLLLVVFSTACVQEELGSCDFPHQLTFHYTHNVESTDLFSEEIDHINLFIYDKSGQLIKQESIEKQQLTAGNSYQVMLPVGEYSFVAHGNVKDAFDYQGVESLQSAVLSVHRDKQGSTSPAFKDMFYAVVNNVKHTIHKQEEATCLFFRKNSNLVRVIIRHINQVAALPSAKCTISAVNGDYKFDNTIFGTNRIHYTPLSQTKSNDLTTEFSVLKLWDGDNSNLNVTELKGDSIHTWYNGNLSSLLLQKPGTDLDLEDTFEVILNLDNSNTEVTITVNDWEVVDHNSGLQ